MKWFAGSALGRGPVGDDRVHRLLLLVHVEPVAERVDLVTPVARRAQGVQGDEGVPARLQRLDTEGSAAASRAE
jgi:hypothetical protein